MLMLIACAITIISLQFIACHHMGQQTRDKGEGRREGHETRRKRHETKTKFANEMFNSICVPSKRNERQRKTVATMTKYRLE